MKYIHINCSKLSNINELHEILAKELLFPDYYGNNLDALDEVLNDGLFYNTGEFVLYLDSISQLFNMDSRFKEIIDILKLIEAKNGKLEYT